MNDQINPEVFIPKVEGIVSPWLWSCPTGTGYTMFQATRPVYLVPTSPTTAGTCYWFPITQPTADALADSGVMPYLYATGRWFVRHSGVATETFRVIDAGGAGNAGSVAASVTGFGTSVNLTQIAGTSQTGLNLTGRFVPLTWTDSAPITVNAADTAVLAANTSRRGLSCFNASTGGQTIALSTTNPATAANRGFVILPAGFGYIAVAPEAVTQQIIRAYASAAGGTLSYAEGT